MESCGLKRGKNNLEVYVMCEIPNNVISIDEFLDLCDGMSIGSNDLTQLVLGVDRDSELVASIYDERNMGVKKMILRAIRKCKARKKYIGICGQAPSDFIDFTKFLIENGIDSVSLNSDTLLKTKIQIKKFENEYSKKKIKKVIGDVGF